MCVVKHDLHLVFAEGCVSGTGWLAARSTCYHEKAKGLRGGKIELIGYDFEKAGYPCLSIAEELGAHSLGVNLGPFVPNLNDKLIGLIIDILASVVYPAINARATVAN